MLWKLQSNNIFFNQHGNAKIGDFGLIMDNFNGKTFPKTSKSESSNMIMLKSYNPSDKVFKKKSII